MKFTSVPLWAWVGAVLAGELALQLFPSTGIFLMFLGAPLWSILLINLMLVLMLLDGLGSPARRWLIAIPAVVYAASAIASLESQLQYRHLATNVANYNNRHSVAAGVSARSLLVDEGTSQTLAGHWNVDHFYVERAEQVYNADIVTFERCASIEDRADDPFVRQGVVDSGRYGGPPTLCKVETPVRARPEALTFTSKLEKHYGLLPTSLTTVSASNGASAIAGAASLLYPVPLPAIGCFLNDAKGSWDCFAHLLRYDKYVGPSATGFHSPPGVADALATALSLPKRRDGSASHFDTPLAGRGSQAPFPSRAVEQRLAEADTASDAEFATDLKLLPALAASDEPDMPRGLRWALARHADRLDNRAEWLLKLLEGARNPSIRATLTTVIASLPSDGYARIAPELVTYAEQARQPGDDGMTDSIRTNMSYPLTTDFLARLGDAGPRAVPFLVSEMTRPGSVDDQAAAVLGLCREGSSAAGARSSIADFVKGLERENSARAYEITLPAYVTLRRLGDPALAEEVLSGYPKVRYQVLPDMQDISAASPAWACRTQFNDPFSGTPWLEPARIAMR